MCVVYFIAYTHLCKGTHIFSYEVNKVRAKTGICKNPHRYNPTFLSLPEYQGQEGRHKCAACAFELGIKDALEGRAMAQNDLVLANIPFSQAGTVRHRDAYEAYVRGWRLIHSNN